MLPIPPGIPVPVMVIVMPVIPGMLDSEPVSVLLTDSSEAEAEGEAEMIRVLVMVLDGWG